MLGKIVLDVMLVVMVNAPVRPFGFAQVYISECVNKVYESYTSERSYSD